MVGKIALFIVALFFVQATTPPKVVLFFGDSLSAGYGLNPEDAFPALVEKSLVKQGVNARVVNAGLSGETTAGGLSRIDWILRQPIDVFVLELGGNDGLRGLPVTQTKKNLQTIIDRVKAKYPKCQIVLTGMLVPPNMGPEYAKGFQSVFREVAASNKLVFVPFLLEGVGGIEKLNQADGIHPNAEGHKIVAGNLTKVIKPLL